jgi:hypothetical protein
MSQQTDMKAFARLRGKEESSGWVKWGEIFALSLFLAGFVLIAAGRFGINS